MVRAESGLDFGASNKASTSERMPLIQSFRVVEFPDTVILQ